MPSDSIEPHVGWVAGRPKPRYWSTARMRIALAIWKVTVTTIVPIVFGMMWRTMIRQDRLHVFTASQAQGLSAHQASRDQTGDDRQQDDQQGQGRPTPGP